jgi:hypothetical protein
MDENDPLALGAPPGLNDELPLITAVYLIQHFFPLQLRNNKQPRYHLCGIGHQSLVHREASHAEGLRDH